MKFLTEVGVVNRMQNETERKIQELTNQIVNAQSKAFNMTAQLTEERDMARAQANQWQEVLGRITTILGLENPSIEDVMKKVTSLMPKPKGVKGAGK